jgi:hypothetical protein
MRTREQKIAALLGEACYSATWDRGRFAKEIANLVYAERDMVFFSILEILSDMAWTYRNGYYVPMEADLLAFGEHLDAAARAFTAQTNSPIARYYVTMEE